MDTKHVSLKDTMHGNQSVSVTNTNNTMLVVDVGHSDEIGLHISQIGMII